VPESRASPNSRHELTSYVVPPPPRHLDSSLLMLYPRLSLSSSPRSRVRADVVVEEGLVGHHAPTQHRRLPDASLETATVGLHELEGENFLRRERETTCRLANEKTTAASFLLLGLYSIPSVFTCHHLIKKTHR
jgi:hypothetical protein